MNADQIIEGIGKAVAATKPVPEYCFLWIDHWSTCMTKSEWSGWMQAVFSVIAILAAVRISTRQRREDLADEHDKQLAAMRTYLEAAKEAQSAIEDVANKINGRNSHTPYSSLPRIESLQQTLPQLLILDAPNLAKGTMLRIMRELALSVRAIKEASGQTKFVDPKLTTNADLRRDSARQMVADLEQSLEQLVSSSRVAPGLFCLRARLRRGWKFIGR